MLDKAKKSDKECVQRYFFGFAIRFGWKNGYCRLKRKNLSHFFEMVKQPCRGFYDVQQMIRL